MLHHQATSTPEYGSFSTQLRHHSLRDLAEQEGRQKNEMENTATGHG